MVADQSRAAPPAHSGRRTPLLRGTGAAVPIGAAAPVADRAVADRDRGAGHLTSPDPSRDDLLLSVVVPAFNEVATLAAALRQLRRTPLTLDVIAVDDASTDRTGPILDRLRHRRRCP